MNHEDMLKEMHNKVHICTLPSKLTMQALICITMTYEAICATARSAAAQENLVYVPHTILWLNIWSLLIDLRMRLMLLLLPFLLQPGTFCLPLFLFPPTTLNLPHSTVTPSLITVSRTDLPSVPEGGESCII